MHQKLNILQICPAYYPALSIGGPILAVLSLTKVLTRRHNVDTLTTPLGLAAQEKNQLDYHSPVQSVCGSRLFYKKYYGYPHFTFSPGTLLWLLSKAAHYDLALLHGVWNFPLIVAALICQWRKVPYIIMPHGTIYRETIELKSSFLKRLLLKVCVHRMLARAARILFTTEDEARKVSHYLGLQHNLYIAPNIVEASEFAKLPERGIFRAKYGIDANCKILLHYGRITQKKGIEYTIRALAKLRKKGHDVKLVVVGGDAESYKLRLQVLIKELFLEEDVLFTGLLDREQGKTALVDSNIFVLPSLSENFGMAVVEAMLCHLPVVISNNVGIADDVKKADAGLVVTLEPGDDSLVNMLAELLGDSRKCLTLAERGYRFAIENYDSNAVEARINSLLTLIWTSNKQGGSDINEC